MQQKLVYTYASVRGNTVLCRGYNAETGERFDQRVKNFSPEIFAKTATKKDQDVYRSIYGEQLQRITPGDVSECRNFIDRYSGVDGFELHGMTDWTIQFLSGGKDSYFRNNLTDLFSFEKTKIWFIDIETEITEGNGFPQPEFASERVQLITVYDSVEDLYTVYSFKSFDTSKTLEKLLDYGIDPQKIKFSLHDSEEKMLRTFLCAAADHKPDAITGWNVEQFDIPYIIRRLDRIFTSDSFNSKLLSPWKFIRERYINKNGEKTLVYDIDGVAILDYLALMKKFTYGDRESWKLGDVAFTELDETKIELDTSFRETYTTRFAEFVAYNIIDVYLVKRLDEKLRLLSLAYTVSYTSRVNPDDVFSPIKLWDALIYNHLKNKNIVVPMHRRREQSAENSRQIAGGWVKDPIPGRYEYIASYDFASLYPSLIMTHNISPETHVPRSELMGKILNNSEVQNNTQIVEYVNSGQFFTELDTVSPTTLLDKTKLSSFFFETLKLSNLSLCANGSLYTRAQRGFMGEMMAMLYAFRKTTKTEMLTVEREYNTTKNEKLKSKISSLNAKQMAWKILLNSAYGAQASPYFRYFSNILAEAITLSGQYITQQVGNDLNKFLNKANANKLENSKDYVVYSDTDSIYVSYADLLNKFIPDANKSEKIAYILKFSNGIFQRVIDKSCNDAVEGVNGYEMKLIMKTESICDVALWVAKKRYILNIHNNEGVQYATPKIKIVGLEMVRSSTPYTVRVALTDVLREILFGTEVSMRAWIAQYKKQFFNESVEHISFPRGVHGIRAYTGASDNEIYQKGCPIHTRGALLYNHLLEKYKLTDKYEKIGEGNKMKFVYLKMPNTIREDVIGFNGNLPPEFDLHKFVDYDKMFNKTFEEPLRGILTPINWELKERTPSLEDLFS